VRSPNCPSTKRVDAVGGTFECSPTYGTYPVTKYLMTQLAREVTQREADAGNKVYAYSWAPGNIYTDLNPFASCCIGPLDNPGQTCRYQLPYVGPKDDDGNPNPPDPPVQNHWTSPAHGAMAAMYAALMANASESGSFFATYWECEVERGYFPQGVTQEARSEIYELSKSWAGIASAVPTSPPSALPSNTPTSSGTTLSTTTLTTLFLIIGLGLHVW